VSGPILIWIELFIATGPKDYSFQFWYSGLAIIWGSLFSLPTLIFCTYLLITVILTTKKFIKITYVLFSIIGAVLTRGYLTEFGYNSGVIEKFQFTPSALSSVVFISEFRKKDQISN
jgi:hypothetical protein